VTHKYGDGANLLFFQDYVPGQGDVNMKSHILIFLIAMRATQNNSVVVYTFAPGHTSSTYFNSTDLGGQV
jgi:hypothetical protein